VQPMDVADVLLADGIMPNNTLLVLHAACAG
jgi:hypothetical protein